MSDSATHSILRDITYNSVYLLYLPGQFVLRIGIPVCRVSAVIENDQKERF
jgi:hypothetical protein